MVKRRRRPVIIEDDTTAEHRVSFSPKSDRWFAKEFEVTDGGFFQGRDANGDIIYRLDREGMQLRDLDEPNPIEWTNQAGTTTRRSLWVNLPNHPDTDVVESGDALYAPSGGTAYSAYSVYSGPSDDYWGARLRIYSEDGTQSYLVLQLITTGTPNFDDVLKVLYTTAAGVKTTISGALQVGGSSNYALFDSKGFLKLFGTARVWDDLRIEPVARTTGSTAPSFEQYYTNGAGSRGVYLYSFDDAGAGSEKEIHFTAQMPHNWAQTAIHVHVHWVPAVSDTTATPRWGLEYTWIEPGAVFGNTGIVYATGNEQAATDLVANTHYITEFAALTPTSSQDGFSSIFIGRLFRNSADAADTYNASGAKCGLLYIDIHYEIDKLGSDTEYT